VKWTDRALAGCSACWQVAQRLRDNTRNGNTAEAVRLLAVLSALPVTLDVLKQSKLGACTAAALTAAVATYIAAHAADVATYIAAHTAAACVAAHIAAVATYIAAHIAAAATYIAARIAASHTQTLLNVRKKGQHA
jgi:hypothetical protein